METTLSVMDIIIGLPIFFVALVIITWIAETKRANRLRRRANILRRINR